MSLDDTPCYTDSDVLLGRQVPGCDTRTIYASRAAAIAKLDAVPDEKWSET
ncbi:hypothetical protein [Burkholderia ubonensis]|uniref:hypothetical protein n=1 Tax=Burkholderia ubonensis TaxID=101571 RepID=UPI001E49AA3D|nr:hypothetical protein [Burkholderia ubonensis]